MDQSMPYVVWPFFVSPLGQKLFMVYGLVLAVCHMQYVHSRVDISRLFTLGELVADLIGLTWMRNLCQAFYPEMKGLQIFLFVHFVVHALSLMWSIVGWSSLSQHMMDFRRRKGNAIFNASEWLYEQSDTSLYLFLAMRILTHLPPAYAMALVIAASFAAGSPQLKGWFGRSTEAQKPQPA